MDYGPSSLEDWVAVKKDVFSEGGSESQVRFLVAWNEEEQKIAVICQEKNGKTCNRWKSTQTKMLSLSDLFFIHKQLTLIKSEEILNQYFRKIFDGREPKCKRYSSKDCSLTEEYLSLALSICGHKILLGILFDEDQTFLDDYEENLNELRMKSYEQAVEEEFCELSRVLELRLRAETLLEMMSIYSAEGEVIERILTALGHVYNFQLWQFLEEREYAQTMIQHVQDDLITRLIGEKLRENYEMDLKKWKDQFHACNEAVQQLYQEYYRKAWQVLKEQEDRMLEDQAKFGKAAYEIHALDQMLKLEVRVCQEKLKFLHVIKASRESNRDRIRERNGKERATAAYVDEIYEANLSILNIKMEISEEEEALLLKKKEILNKARADMLQQEIFYDAPESVYESEMLEARMKQNPEFEKLQAKLSNVYRKKAALRNKKKAYVQEREVKYAKLEEEKRKYNQHHAVHLKRKEREKKHDSVSETVHEERKKTLQRLKHYRKKFVVAGKDGEENVLDSKQDDIDPVLNALNTSHTSTTKSPSTSTYQKKTTVTKPSKNLSSPPPSVPINEEKKPVPSALMEPQPQIPHPINIPLALPPPPPPPPPLINIPPPPPLPPLNATALSFTPLKPLEKVQKKKSEDAGGLPTVNLSDILAMRTKLKKVDLSESEKRKALPDGSLSSILQAVTERIRASHFDSDSSEESENDDFDD